MSNGQAIEENLFHIKLKGSGGVESIAPTSINPLKSNGEFNKSQKGQRFAEG